MTIYNSNLSLLQDIKSLPTHNTNVLNSTKQEIRNELAAILQALQMKENEKNTAPHYGHPSSQTATFSSSTNDLPADNDYKQLLQLQ